MAEIRPAKPEDYWFIAETFRLYDPHYSATAEDILRVDQNLEPHLMRKRFVAELNNRVVGYAVVGQNAEYFHPQKFWINGLVHPHHVGKGIGSQLWERLWSEIAPYNPIVTDVGVREDWPHSIRFVQKLGFVEATRAWESHLNPQTFNPALFADPEAKLLSQGFAIKSYDQLATDSERDAKYWQLEMALTADMPSNQAFTPYSFEHFQKNFLNSPNFIPEANLFAIAPDGSYVALNALWKEGKNLGNGTTGTHQSFKRRGLALALKVKNLVWAKTHGYTDIKTFNRSDNLPMWSINEQLGFVREPAWINFEKHLTQGDL